MTLKRAVEAEMPRASVTIATPANPGLLARVRRAYRKSWRTVAPVRSPPVWPALSLDVDMAVFPFDARARAKVPETTAGPGTPGAPPRGPIRARPGCGGVATARYARARGTGRRRRRRT